VSEPPNSVRSAGRTPDNASTPQSQDPAATEKTPRKGLQIIGRDLRCYSRSWMYLRVHRPAQVQTIMTQVASAAVRMYGESVFRQQLEPLPFRQVARRDDLEVPAVKGSDLVQV
jgi:hypothetical protein